MAGDKVLLDEISTGAAAQNGLDIQRPTVPRRVDRASA
jgi:hypothetical protein